MSGDNSLVLAYPKNPLIQSEIYEGKTVFRCSLSMRRMLTSYIDYGFNVSFRETKGMGVRIDNGSFTGLLGDLGNQRAEASAFPVPIGTATDIVSYKLPVSEYNFVLYSNSRPDTHFDVDILYSLSTLDPYCILVVIALLICSFIILKKRFSFNVINFISAMFSQYISKKFQHIHKPLWITIILLFYSCQNFLLADFSAELAVSKQSRKIDTLNDVIELNATPIFVDVFSADGHFREGVTEEYQKVWSRVMKIGLEKCFMKLSETNPLFVLSHFSNAVSGQEVLIAPQGLTETLTRAGCIIDCAKFVSLAKKGFRIHSSAPFHSKVLGYPMSLFISQAKSVMLNNLYYHLFENGYIAYYRSQYANFYSAAPYNLNCEHSYMIIMSQTNDWGNLKLRGFIGSVSLLFVFIFISMLSLFVERKIFTKRFPHRETRRRFWRFKLKNG